MEKIFEVKLIEKIDAGENRVTLYFDIPEGFSWEPSAHISLALKGYDKEGEFDKDYIRKFSINTLMCEGKIGITTRTDSSDSLYKKMIKSMEVGEKCNIIESGCRLPIRREGKDIVLISMGVGMATMRPLINSMINDLDGIKSVTNISVNKTDNFLYKDEMNAEDHLVCNSIYCHHRTDLKETIENLCHDTSDKIFYVVGSRDFVQNMVTMLKSNGVKKENIMIDKKPGVIDGLYAGLNYDDVKNRMKSKTFKKIELPSAKCGCNGNCTCK